MYYTLGQRGGIGLGGLKGAAEGAWFVLHKDLANNRLVVGQGHEHPLMQSTQLWSESIDWVAGEQNIPVEGLRCTAKTRYRQPDQTCTILLMKTLNTEFALSSMNLSVLLHRVKALYFIQMKFA